MQGSPAGQRAMPFLELTLHCRESEQPRYENALDDVGALAVTMLDANAGTGNEDAILEPGVGETPLWAAITLSALFAHDADPLLLLAALESFQLANGLALSLEFKMAAEILKTVIIRDIEELMVLGAVIVLRALLSFLIHFEMKHSQ